MTHLPKAKSQAALICETMHTSCIARAINALLDNAYEMMLNLHNVADLSRLHTQMQARIPAYP